ncbi:HPr family phosphocarrier protein [Sphingomicrobium astaxanthinifaciens]|uniref:HPr family phosphocarrier protein n=1 Tax=Sphingomicrobium astaxanthinifaciens TaxID=1227949 RepID=UPI001FCC8D85|nr:HPr family phosphocarrier protein [Sphingomicrobium astaxanthinifaciens]MCJ7422196.1 HPr family phosphocarrier protein [Sphingomicrobium astaxanthinifaciens]
MTVSKKIKISNRRGLHARASAKFVNLVHEIGDGVTVEVEKDGNRVTGKSIMGLMMLGAAMGDCITIHVEGANAKPALDKLAGLVKDRFYED